MINTLAGGITIVLKDDKIIEFEKRANELLNWCSKNNIKCEVTRHQVVTYES